MQESRSSTLEAENNAIGRGRFLLLTTLTVVGFLTLVFAFLWLQVVTSFGSTPDLPQSIGDFGDHLGLSHPRACLREGNSAQGAAECAAPDPSTTMGVLAAFGAIAIACVVALGASLRELERLREQGPKVSLDADRTRGSMSTAPPSTRMTNPAIEWLRRRAMAQALTLTELLVALACAGFSLLTTVALCAAGVSLMAAIAGLLTAFLVFESTRYFFAYISLSELQIRPVPLLVAGQLNGLAKDRRPRSLYEWGQWTGWLVASVALSITLSSAVGIRAGLSLALAFLSLTIVVQLFGRSFAGTAITEFRSSRRVTLTGALVFTIGVVLSLCSSVLGSALSGMEKAPDNEAHLWWLLGEFLAVTVLSVATVLDAGGMPRRWSTAILHRGRVPSGTQTPGTRRRWIHSLFFLLGVTILSNLMLGAVTPTALMGGVWVFCSIVLLALARRRSPPLRAALTGGACAAPLAGGISANDPTIVLWALYALLPVLALAFVSMVPTRTGLLLADLVDQASPVASLRQRAQSAWHARLAVVGIVDTGIDGNRFIVQDEPLRVDETRKRRLSPLRSHASRIPTRIVRG